MERWTSIVLTAVLLVAGAGIAWGVMSTSVDAATLRIERIEIRQEVVERRATATEWMLYRICEKVGAHPCTQPGGSP